MFKCVLSKMKYFLSSFELRRQMILLIFSVRFQFNNLNYSITTSRFLRLNLSEMHMRTLWHQTIGRFYYPGSQHQHWINSTVHNLGKLVFLEQLCGFCCFSMRFVVMIDLLSTLIQPVSVAYLSYVITLHSLIIDFSSRCISYISCILLSQRAKPSL